MNKEVENNVKVKPYSLQVICLEKLSALWYNVHDANVIKRLPQSLRNEALHKLIKDKKLTDETVSYFFCVMTTHLPLRGLNTLRNSALKQIGYLCPHLVWLDLSQCRQVTNSVVQSALRGCENLRGLWLDHCPRVTDSAFQMHDSPFAILFGALSLEIISLQGCPQVTGELVFYLRKICRKLRVLNLSQCKHILKQNIQEIFLACYRLETLNLAFLEHLNDDAFESLAQGSEAEVVSVPDAFHPCTDRPLYFHQQNAQGGMESLRTLNLGRCSITDATLVRVAGLRELLKLQLPCCLAITDYGVKLLVKGCPHLQQLDLQNCGLLTDATAESVASFPGLSQIRSLNLSWCAGVTDVGVSAVAAGSCAQSVRDLRFNWCEQITDASIERLAQSCTRLERIELGGCIRITKVASSRLVEKGILVQL